MLKVDHLSTSYKTLDGDVHVINDLNFEIRENEIFGIAGESGCGKSTLLKPCTTLSSIRSSSIREK